MTTTPELRISILTGFPRMFEGPLDEGMLRVAQKMGKVDIRIVHLREFTEDVHRTIDDSPYGGGPGMVLKIEPVVRALESLPPPLDGRREVVLLTPQGERLDQKAVRTLLEAKDVVLVFGRYKGIDDRIREFVTREISIGDYILSGGEPAALIVADALTRLVPGVLGDMESAEGDSFERTILDSGYYTRPEDFRGLKVPEVYLSGHHKRIEEARRRDALLRTLERRPDLLETATLSDEEVRWLRAEGWESRP
ncbi:MAG: tRNA (guanosine(37)-N1)-methyltransferase TrmD [Candidatus Eisenbacteria bacterium]|uniref:tRNA (guanine-N(1)-)-methyltransferase n=1 Tax=Eiseniibacteriota bacterium TaxID=2212470 RepID=A0A956SD98_UNCEI|nr:tRNA (guanosine(37)-N1)-methyltransferase TrmD [Candidatus Eisenbacteria bacterium]